MRNFVASAVLAATGLLGLQGAALAIPTDNFSLFSVVQNAAFDSTKPVAVFDPANDKTGTFADHISVGLNGFAAPIPAEAKLDLTITFTSTITISDPFSPKLVADITLTTGGQVFAVGSFGLADLAGCADALDCTLTTTKSVVIPVAAQIVGSGIDLAFDLSGTVSGLSGNAPCVDCVVSLDTASWTIKADTITYGDFTGTGAPGGSGNPPPVNAIPEPGTLPLLAAGLVGALGLGRRRRG